MKLAIVQINYKPAMIMNNRDLLVEPLGNTDTSVSIEEFQGSQNLQKELKDKYISWIRIKVTSILSIAKSHNVQIIVFPEYSIPFEILNELSKSLQDSNMHVVAGTHMVTNNTTTKPIIGYPPDIKPFIRCAMCPIVTAEGIKHYVFKRHAAAPEINNISLPSNYTPTPLLVRNQLLHTNICLDAISLDSELPKDKNSIIAIPAWSNNLEPFKALQTITKYNEWPVLYANAAEVGGSLISAPYLKTDAHWFFDSTLNHQIPKNTEGMVIASIDVDSTKHSVGTVNTIPSSTIEGVYNIFYRYEEKHKKVMNKIDSYINNFDEIPNPQALESLEDSLYLEKLRFLKQQYKNGVLTQEVSKDCLKYISVNLPSFNSLIKEQVTASLKKVSSAFTQEPTNSKLINTMQSLATKLNTMHNKADVSEELDIDEQMFYGRDEEVVVVGQFINSEEKILVLSGIRGIGKSKLLKNIEGKVIPDNSPWTVKYIGINQGIGYEFLLDSLSYDLGLNYNEKKDATPIDLAKRYKQQIEAKGPMIIQLDDVHHLTESNGEFSDTNVKEFFIELLRQLICLEDKKIILSTNRRIPSVNALPVQIAEVKRLSDDVVRTIIKYCYQKKSNSIQPLKISDATIKYIYGNPLTAILVAELIGDNKLAEFETKGELFKRFQEQQIKNLLDEIDFTEEEKEIIDIIAVGKGSLSENFIKENHSYLLPTIKQLINRLIIEYDNGEFKIHPIFQDYYYNQLSFKERTDYHNGLSKYYESICSNNKNDSHNPKILSNLIYHLGGSMQRDKLIQYKSKYVDELLPIAHTLYREQRYDEALEYYELIHTSIGERKDILIKMAQCCVYSNKLEEAEEYFKLSIEANPSGAKLYAQYSIALSSRRNTQQRARDIAEEAERIYLKYGKTDKWELIKIKFALAKSFRDSDPNRAKELYKEVYQLEPTNVYYLCMYAKFLFEHNLPEDGKSILNEAISINPKHQLCTQFYEKFINKENRSVVLDEVAITYDDENNDYSESENYF